MIYKHSKGSSLKCRTRFLKRTSHERPSTFTLNAHAGLGSDPKEGINPWGFAH